MEMTLDVSGRGSSCDRRCDVVMRQEESNISDHIANPIHFQGSTPCPCTQVKHSVLHNEFVRRRW